jgi:hypothetical protein
MKTQQYYENQKTKYLMHVPYNSIDIHVFSASTKTRLDAFSVNLLIIRLFVQSANP